jgi:hypothetical protein
VKLGSELLPVSDQLGSDNLKPIVVHLVDKLNAYISVADGEVCVF